VQQSITNHMTLLHRLVIGLGIGLHALMVAVFQNTALCQTSDCISPLLVSIESFVIFSAGSFETPVVVWGGNLLLGGVVLGWNWWRIQRRIQLADPAQRRRAQTTRAEKTSSTTAAATPPQSATKTNAAASRSSIEQHRA